MLNGFSRIGLVALLGLAACHHEAARVTTRRAPPSASSTAPPIATVALPEPAAEIPFDFEKTPFVALQSAPAQAAAPKPIGERPTAKKALHELSRVPEKEAFGRTGYQPYDPSEPTTLFGELPRGAPTGIPLLYRQLRIDAIATSDGKLLVGYGNGEGSRYVAVATGTHFDRVIDLAPDALDLGERDENRSDVHQAILDGDVLYACRGYNHPTRSRKGYVMALDAKTGELRWRSRAQTCGGWIERFGDYVVTGFSDDSMPYTVFLLRVYDGTAAQSFRNDGAFRVSSVEDEKLVVRTYRHRITYELR